MQNSQSYIVTKTVAAVWILLLAAGCSQQPSQENTPAAPVQTAEARRDSIHRFVKSRGILHAYNQSSVTPKISAAVTEFYVNRGAHVRKGQLLAVLESRDLAAAVADAKGQLDQAEANFRGTTAASLPEELTKAQADVASAREALDAAQRVLESRKSLADQGALARRQVDEANVAFVQARSQYEVALKHLNALDQVGRDANTKQAQALVEAARGRLQAAQAQLEYAKILSPIDGVIADRPLYPGEMSAAGAPLLTVMDISRVIARANVPSDQLRFIKTGDPATIYSPDDPGEAEGKVTVVSPALDPSSTTAEVWVEAQNPGGRMKPGSSVQVSILAGTVADAVVIPKAAILPGEAQAPFVMVVGADSVAQQRIVEIGIQENDRVQVVKGLDPGEQVVVVGGLGLEDKARVVVEKPEEKTGEKPEKKTDKK